MPFRVSVEGESYLTDDLTLDEAIAIEAATGHSWVDVNPFRSAEDCKAIMVAFLARTAGADEARRRVGALSLKAVMSSVDVVPDDLPDAFEGGLPLAEAAPSTAGPSGPSAP